MKKFLLLVFFYQSSVVAMVESQPDKMYVRVVVTGEKRAALAMFAVTCCDEMQEFLAKKYEKECSISGEIAKRWAYEVIHQDTGDSQGFMRGFVGDKKYLESCVEILKKNLNVQVMYHYKEPAYERIGLTDVPAFLKGAAYLQACERHVKKLSQQAPVPIEMRDLLFKRKECECFCGDSSKTDEVLYAPDDDETAFIVPLSENVDGKSMQGSDSSLRVSSSQGSRYSNMSVEASPFDSELAALSVSAEMIVQQPCSEKTQTPKARSVTSHLRVETPREPALEKELIELKK